MKNIYAGITNNFYIIGPYDNEVDAINEFKEEYPNAKTCVLGKMKQLNINIDGLGFYTLYTEDLYDNTAMDSDFYMNCTTDIPKEEYDKLGADIANLLNDFITRNNKKQYFNVISEYKKVDL